MYERFTDRARKVMQLANQEAQRLNHEYIGTEHILLGLMKEGSGVAANVLKNLDIDLRQIRLEIEKFVQLGPEKVATGGRPQTPRAKKIVEYSIDEARHLNHNYVGTEHLLLGLLREQEGVAAQVLENLGLNLQGVRQEVLLLLGGKAPSRIHSEASPNGFERAARRWGSWTRKHQVEIACVFGAGLTATLAGAWAEGHFPGLEQANSGALIAGGAYVLGVAISCLASRAQRRFSRQVP
jgi:ATP-dependent Clp protease ATP-binding subunit ClpC